MSANISSLLYLVSGVLFVLALRGLSSPTTARQGNYFGMAGMLVAVVTTLTVMDTQSLTHGALSSQVLRLVALLAR